MQRYAVMLMGCVALVLTGAGARAEFVSFSPSESSIPASDDLFLNNGVVVGAFTGSVGAQSAGPLINAQADVMMLQLGNGWSTISGVNSDLTSVTFTPANQNLFTEFSTRGQLNVAGPVTITVTDNFAQSFTFTEKANQDWDRIGVIALQGSGEFINSVSVSTDPGNLKELKQISFGTEVMPIQSGSVPEPASAVLVGTGLISLVLFRVIRKWIVTRTYDRVLV